MTIYAGTGFIGFIDHAFTGTLASVIGVPPTGGRIVLSAWLLSATGAVVSPKFVGHTSTSAIAKKILTNPGDWASSPDTLLRLPANDDLDIAGGAASGVLNGYICFHFEGSGGTASLSSAGIVE